MLKTIQYTLFRLLLFPLLVTRLLTRNLVHIRHLTRLHMTTHIQCNINKYLNQEHRQQPTQQDSNQKIDDTRNQWMGHQIGTRHLRDFLCMNDYTKPYLTDISHVVWHDGDLVRLVDALDSRASKVNKQLFLSSALILLEKTLCVG